MKSKYFSLCILWLGLFTAQQEIAHAQDVAEPGHNFMMPDVQRPSFKKDTFNIINYGAKSDGITLNTESINTAIDACNKNGGGVVLIPDGLWLTGPITIKSNVNLHIKRGALLQFTRDHNAYPLIKSNYEGVAAVRCQSPITAENETNIAITGNGVIDGGGDTWREVKKNKLTPDEWKQQVASGGVVSDDEQTWYPSQEYILGTKTKNAGVIENGKTIQDFEAIKDFLRPNLLSFFGCKKVLLQGVTFENSPAWCLHPLLCENLTVDHITVNNSAYAQNGDGIDLESSKEVIIENSTFATGDDGICIKSGKNEEGRKRGVPTQDVLVRNCVVYHAHGGFVIGSEMSGGVKNIYVTDCSFIGSDNGLRFKTTRGRGGVVENIYISHINMENIVGDAILFDMYYENSNSLATINQNQPIPPVTVATPAFRNFYIKDIVCLGAHRAIFIRGLPEMNVKNVYMKNLTLKATIGMQCIEGTNIHINNLHLITNNTDPEILLQNSNDITLNKIQYNPGAKLLFHISGDSTKNITVSNTDVSAAQKEVDFTDGADKQVLNIK